jgi:nucleotide-binding universal stress UspA family protein
MSATWFLVGVFALWLLIGLVSATVMGRRGYAPFTWLVLGAVLGPLVIPLAVARMRDARRLPYGPNGEFAHRGPVDVLVGVDGSPESRAAAGVVTNLLADRVGRLTLAAVVDYDTALGGPAALARREAEDDLSSAAAGVRNLGYDAETIVLAGRPAEVLGAHAADGGFDVLAIGSRGRGASKLVMGSVASSLSRRAPVPVLVVTNHPEAILPRAS